jgi:soluble lytic murein transglycosylase-like protein
MTIAPLAPVLARITAIQSRFPSPQRTVVGAAQGGGVDFAATLASVTPVTSVMPVTPSVAASSAPIAPAPATATRLTPTLSPVATASSPDQTVLGASPSNAADVPFAAEFNAAGQRYGVPSNLLAAVGWVESRYQQDAVSPAGAIGVMQLMPFVADELGVDATAPASAIDGAARLLAGHYARFGSWVLAIAAYHSGGGAVSRAGNAIPTPRAAEYVRRVTERINAS